MKNYLLGISCLFIIFCSCEKDQSSKGKEVEAKTVKNLKAFIAQEGDGPHKKAIGYRKFSFSKGMEVAEDSKDWDIAFKTTTILVNGGESSNTEGEPKRTGNGGCYITEGLLDEVTIDAKKIIAQDVPKTWYTYNSQGKHIIRPIPGMVIVIRTHNGKYAKMVIDSYYKDSNTEDAPRYYTFKYIYQ